MELVIRSTNNNGSLIFSISIRKEKELQIDDGVSLELGESLVFKNDCSIGMIQLMILITIIADKYSEFCNSGMLL